MNPFLSQSVEVDKVWVSDYFEVDLAADDYSPWLLRIELDWQRMVDKGELTSGQIAKEINAHFQSADGTDQVRSYLCLCLTLPMLVAVFYPGLALHWCARQLSASGAAHSNEAPDC